MKMIVCLPCSAQSEREFEFCVKFGARAKFFSNINRVIRNRRKKIHAGVS